MTASFRVGQFEVGSPIGEGGMGRVYLAKHRMLSRQYAVKVIHPELAANATLSARFLREARSAAKIKSDYVVSIFDFGELDSGSLVLAVLNREGGTSNVGAAFRDVAFGVVRQPEQELGPVGSSC